MDFELPEELRMIKSLARDFVADQLKPLERDLLGRSADLSDARQNLDSETESRLVQAAKEVGLWGASVPEQFGGGGLGTLANCLIEEELAQSIVPFRFGDVTPVLFECNDLQRDRYLAPTVEGRRACLIALVEPGGTELPSMNTTAKLKGEYFVVNGTKMATGRTTGDCFFIVFAGAENGLPTCLLVDGNTPGLTTTGAETATGWKAATYKHLVHFESCTVPQANLLGQPGKAFSLGSEWLPARRIVRSARIVGLCQRLLDETVVRAQTWQTFGSTVSARPPARVMLAEMATMLRAARLTVYEAAWKADEGRLSPADAATARLFASRTFSVIADRAAQIYGGPPITAARFCGPLPAGRDSNLSIEIQSSIVVRELLAMSRS